MVGELAMKPSAVKKVSPAIKRVFTIRNVDQQVTVLQEFILMIRLQHHGPAMKIALLLMAPPLRLHLQPQLQRFVDQRALVTVPTTLTSCVVLHGQIVMLTSAVKKALHATKKISPMHSVSQQVLANKVHSPMILLRRIGHAGRWKQIHLKETLHPMVVASDGLAVSKQNAVIQVLPVTRRTATIHNADQQAIANAAFIRKIHANLLGVVDQQKRLRRRQWGLNEASEQSAFKQFEANTSFL